MAVHRRPSCSAFSAPSPAASPAAYGYVPVKSGPQATTANTRAGQRAASPHSRSASEAKSAAAATTETSATRSLPTSAAGK